MRVEILCTGDEILSGLGYGKDKIEELKKSGVVLTKRKI